MKSANARAVFVLALLASLAGGAAAERDGGGAWSFRPLAPSTPPAVAGKEWPRSPLDLFILAALEARGLEPAPGAAREALIRRVTFDLTGLPPSAGEAAAFLADAAPDAYERLAERLLASPRHGERWGRHWLDVARFAESHGFEFDRLRENAWRYRDYVISSLNADKPYGEFVQEQIAGDVLEPFAAERVTATGFLVAGPWDEAGNLQQSQVMRARAREEELEDVVSAVCQTFLGLTVNCARCHDHKFDPIPQRDYYRIKAAFEGIRHGERSLLGPAEEKERETLVEGLRRRATEAEGAIAALEGAARARLAARRETRPAPGLPAPLARWSFEGDARDAAGPMHGTLAGGARLAGGRLRLGGKGAHLRTEPLGRDLREKTIEAWVGLAALEQRGGGVVSIEAGEGAVFDALVFGERESRKWLAGSDHYRRTRDLAGAREGAGPQELVHLVVTYDGAGRIALYRNGAAYGESYVPGGEGSGGPVTYRAGEARVLIGLRHTGAGNGFLAGDIEEARLFDRALSPAEVQAAFAAGPGAIPEEEVIASLTPAEVERRAALAAEVRAAEAALAAVPPAPLAYAANSREPEPTFVLERGDVERRGELVSAGAIASAAAPPPDFGLAPDAPEGERRRRLAAWIASPENPLTARTAANRLWHWHFGHGIAASPSDLGASGERPTHPELLDWLAAELQRAGGSWKRLHRLLVLSSTYRQSSRFDSRAAALDAEDRLLWRFPPRRLEAEAVRDAMLAVSGDLNLALGGPSFRPFNVQVFGSNIYTVTDPEGPEFNRRTVYRMCVNSADDPMLEALDCPEPSVKAPQRTSTTTPLQALSLMNSGFVARQARAFARRLRSEAGAEATNQAALAYLLSFGRQPAPAEAARAAALVREQDLESLCWALLNASEFLYLR